MRQEIGSTLAAVAVLALAGCGGSGSESVVGPARAVSPTERLLIAQQVVTAALGGVYGGVARSADAPLGGVTCTQTCSGGSCAVVCPIDERFSCPSGGNATNKGQITGSLDGAGSGEAALSATQTFTDCQPRTGLRVQGAPSTTATGNARLVNGQLAEQQTLRVAGTVSYASAETSGRCEVDLRVTFDRALHGTARGTACGAAIDSPF